LRRVPSLKDFDSWIDAIVGAEELRGAKLSSTGSSNATKPLASGTTNINNSNQNQPGSSNYNNRNPTVLAQSLLEVAVFPECPACKENPGHRLEMCNVFKRMIVNARAALCASNNHCFKCLIRGHYTRKCRRQNAGCKECGGPHHSLLHGADRQFPEASTNKGNNHHLLLVKSMDSGVRPVLLAIVQLLVETFDSVRTTYAVLDPGSEATLVTRNLANSLNLKGPPLLVRFGSFWDSLLVASNVVTFKLNSLDGKHTLEASNVLVVSKITLSQRKIDWPSIKTNWEHLSTLDLPSIDSSKVEVLIGMDFPSAHQTLQIAVPIEGEDGPTAHQTCFGWAVVGKIP
jgi:hypothetical protein